MSKLCTPIHHSLRADDESAGRGRRGAGVRGEPGGAGGRRGDELGAGHQPDGGRGVRLQRGRVRLHRQQVHAAAVVQVRAPARLHLLQGGQ